MLRYSQLINLWFTNLALTLAWAKLVFIKHDNIKSIYFCSEYTKTGPKDPCSGFHCRGKNSKCRVDHEGKPFCACRTHCKLYEYFTGQVCGRDGKQYKNLCHLRHSNCELPYPVSIKKYGRCNPRYLSAG